MALSPAASPAATPGTDSLNPVVGRGGALVACSADRRELLVRRRRFVMVQCSYLKINPKITECCFDLKCFYDSV